ncbi:hypothetical protein FRB90_000359 [Tulasnella sp. 427]|nr:hypothetical protein FRB90_000359 [Tulasnella sp. 427]
MASDSTKLLRTLGLKSLGKVKRPQSLAAGSRGRLPQEILALILEHYHALLPNAPIHPFLLVSRDFYEATIPCLYKRIVYTIHQDRQEQWVSLLTTLSLDKYRGWVRRLEMQKFRLGGFFRRSALSEVQMKSTFINCLVRLPQLRAVSVRCDGEDLHAEILVTISQIPQLEVLELINVKCPRVDTKTLQFSAMDALRELRLTGVREEDLSGKWSAFIPYALNRHMRHLEYFINSQTSGNQGLYDFLRRLDDEPHLSFPELRTIRLAQPSTLTDVDRLVELLRRSTGLLDLTIDSRTFNGTWGTPIDELGPKIPPDYITGLQVIHGPPGLVTSLAAGRPVKKAIISWRTEPDSPLSSSLAALRESTALIECLAIWTNKREEMSLQNIVDLFPQLRSLAICVLSIPAMATA